MKKIVYLFYRWCKSVWQGPYTNLPLGRMPLAFASGGPLLGCRCDCFGIVTTGRPLDAHWRLPLEFRWHYHWLLATGPLAACMYEYLTRKNENCSLILIYLKRALELFMTYTGNNLKYMDKEIKQRHNTGKVCKTIMFLLHWFIQNNRERIRSQMTPKVNFR